jgi:hypothetical protein
MSLPTRIDHGDDLLNKTLQPGWTVESDGFGLLQSRCTFKMDTEKATTVFAITQFNRGDSHPIADYAGLKLYKASYVTEKGGVSTITAEYCGVDSYTHPSGLTDPQCAMVGSSASEDISHHPNFIRLNCTSNNMSGILAGPPDPNGGPINPAGFNNALWTPKVTDQGAQTYQQFIGFMPSQTAEVTKINIKAGVKSYYKPQITVRVLFYVQKGDETATQAEALTFASYVGWNDSGILFRLPEPYRRLAVANGYGGSPNYVPEYRAKIRTSFLITNCSVELFGTTCKVTADLMLSGISGWDKDIYPSLT